MGIEQFVSNSLFEKLGRIITSQYRRINHKNFVKEHPIKELKREMQTYVENNPGTEKCELSIEALECLKKAEESVYQSDAHDKLETAYKIYEEQY